MTKEEMIQWLRDKFTSQDADIANLRKAISSLTFTTLVLNELIKKDVSKEQMKEAIKVAVEQMGRMKAMIMAKETNLDNPGQIWEDHFKVS